MSDIKIAKERGRIPKKLKRNPEDKKAKLRAKKEEEVPKVETNEEEETVYISSKINEIFATSEIVQYFTNKLDKAIELTISFPLKHEIQLTKFLITIGDKTIISKVLTKEKAEEKYTDAISSGNTGIISTFNETYSNYTVNVGNILPKEKVKLTSIFNQMITSQDMSYEFSFLEHYPSFVYLGKKAQSKKIKGKFILNTKSKITRLISPFMDENAQKSTNFKVSFNENYTQATIDFNKDIEKEESDLKKINQKQVRHIPHAFKNDLRRHILNPNPPVNVINNTIANVNQL